MIKNRGITIPLFALFVSSLSVIASESIADETVANIKNKLEQIKDNAAEGDDAFSVEQEEFERMRAQLLEAEQQILAKTASEPSAIIPQEETPSQNTEELTVEGDGLDAAREAIANTDENYEILKEEHEKTLRELNKSKAIAKKASAEQASTENSVNEMKIRLAKLEQELQNTKNKLLVSETEIERLTSVIGNQGKARAQLSHKSKIPDDLAAKTAMNKPTMPSTESDELTITVVAEKSVLRTGPNQNETKLVEVERGTRLRVDDRQGDWFRVTNKSGTRAWISAADVAFGPTEASSPSVTVRIKPSNSESDSETEARAFELLKGGAKK